jgi:dCTP deaminase
LVELAVVGHLLDPQETALPHLGAGLADLPQSCPSGANAGPGAQVPGSVGAELSARHLRGEDDTVEGTRPHTGAPARKRRDTMGILCDTQIRELVSIEPFEECGKRHGTISYGVSSYGYDVRVGTRFKIFTNATSGGVAIVDPKRFTNDLFITIDTAETGRDHVIIPPNSFALAETVEVFDVPRDMLAICVGKSTYARCGIIVNVTPLEPEWRGKVTIEISNTTPLPAKIYANEGIAQMLFIRADRVCARSYADKGGKYQDQDGLTLPKVDGLAGE